jgi:hypothetical protein
VHPVIVLQLLILLMLANGTPVIAKKMVVGSFAMAGGLFSSFCKRRLGLPSKQPGERSRPGSEIAVAAPRLPRSAGIDGRLHRGRSRDVRHL